MKKRIHVHLPSGIRVPLCLKAWLALAGGGFGGVALAADPDHVTFILEGRRNDRTITFPAGRPFRWANSAYTTGTLGKGWNEPDLVPIA